MNNEITLRMATLDDADKLLEIYSMYVTKTAITFEYEVPTYEEFRGRIEKVLRRYPYIVAMCEGEILGYAYVSSFKERAAYDWACETSIYVKMGNNKKGIGRLLYEKLEQILKKQNILNLNACIAHTDEEDEYLTNNSEKFHRRMGYTTVAKFNKCGYKNEKWYDMIWMEKHIGEHKKNPEAVINVNEVDIEWD